MVFKSFSNLYQPCSYTLNIHQLLDLVDDVIDLGPLYTHSCFAFEDKNGFLLKLIHGTQFLDSQIVSAVSITQKLPELHEKCFSKGSEIDLLYKDLNHTRKSQFRTEILSNICLKCNTSGVFRNCGNECPGEISWVFLSHRTDSIDWCISICTKEIARLLSIVRRTRGCFNGEVFHQISAVFCRSAHFSCHSSPNFMQQVQCKGMYHSSQTFLS